MKNEKNSKGKKDAKYLLLLSFTAIGVVYGDIGTSPLYALRVCFSGEHAIEPTRDNVLGVLSLIFWSLILVVSVKYLLLVLRADNQGEGGILALMELVLPKRGRRRAVMLVMGLFGAALLFGDGTITPAISVLSAVEGLELSAPGIKPYIIPITLVILFALFSLQPKGTGGVGLLFGPVMLLWFLVLAVSGAVSVAGNAAVFSAVNPAHALRFFSRHGFEALYTLGAVFLVVTGSEALYADIGHFGRRPIRLAWFAVVFPSLLLNYFGQGALLLEDPVFARNPFYHLVPAWALYPMVALATGATVIASQAVISGVFSLAFQALQLGYLPRMLIRHTSEEEKGQIFIPRVNWVLFAVTAAIVVGFQSSGNLAAAYGVAVTATMVITTVLGYFVLRHITRWPQPAALCAAVFFLTIDLSYFSANILKIFQGGWLPLVTAGTVYVLMSSWYEGRRVVARQIRAYVQPLRTFIEGIDHRSIKKVRGTAIYLTETPLCAPLAFVHNLKHNRIVHERNIFVSFGTKKVPHIRAEDRVKIAPLPEGSYRVLARYGFMDRFDIRAVMRILDNKHLSIDIDDTTFFVGQSILIPTKSVGMSIWRDKLYLFLWRNSERATSYFNIPPERAFEIGAHIKF